MNDTDARAMVQTEPGVFRQQGLKIPAVGPDEALIRVEACGVCGSDIDMFTSTRSGVERLQVFPVIRGHEPVGVIEVIGDELAKSSRLAVGQRVAVDPFIRCGRCRYCLTGHGELCRGDGSGGPNTYSTIPMSVDPGLWGGFATHLFATKNTILYPVPAHISGVRAALFNALGAGIKWAVDAAGARVGSTVLVLGCGQRGLASAIAALAAGASWVGVTGLPQDGYKLALAKELGVSATIDIGNEDLVERVLDEHPDGVDAVIDTTPGAVRSVTEAMTVVRVGGMIVMGGMKPQPADSFPLNQILHKEITIRGVLGTGSEHYRRAIEMIASARYPFERLQTHVVPLEAAEHAIDLLAGRVPNEQPVNVVVETI